MLRSLSVIVVALLWYYLSSRIQVPNMAPIKNVAVIGVSNRTLTHGPVWANSPGT